MASRDIFLLKRNKAAKPAQADTPNALIKTDKEIITSSIITILRCKKDVCRKLLRSPTASPTLTTERFAATYEDVVLCGICRPPIVYTSKTNHDTKLAENKSFRQQLALTSRPPRLTYGIHQFYSKDVNSSNTKCIDTDTLCKYQPALHVLTTQALPVLGSRQ